MKRIANIVGSPRYRDGNTAQFVRKACDGARDAGAEVVDIILYKLKIRGCVDCDGCEKREPFGICKLKDDFQANLEVVTNSDAIIYSSPVYNNNVTAPMKAWFDRSSCMRYSNTNTIVGMPTVIIITCGYPFSSSSPRLDRMIDQLKGVTGDVRYACDKDRVYDMINDCLRAFYVHCIYRELEVVGSLGVLGLEHGKEIAPKRTTELEQSYQLGQKLVASIHK